MKIGFWLDETEFLAVVWRFILEKRNGFRIIREDIPGEHFKENES